LTNQAELDSNPDLVPELTDEQRAKCDTEINGDGSISIECDYDDMGISIDSACASAGGSVVKINFKMDCDHDAGYSKNLNMPACLHGTCDAKEYMEHVNDVVYQMDDDMMVDCDISYEFSSLHTAQPTSMPTVSGAAIGSTSIISIALVSLFAMLW
jgi:hypothetical protein